ncbi:MAG: hypothetical protein JXR36_04195 [Bacteroidales bacterium]|nr:hypothetical protein [Bacteroidales bacterium]
MKNFNEIFDKIISYIKLGDTICKACKRVKISRSTFYENLSIEQRLELDETRVLYSYNKPVIETSGVSHKDFITCSEDTYDDNDIYM